MLEHYKEKNHHMVVSLGSGQMWCYTCDEDFDALIDRFSLEKNKEKAEELVNGIRSLLQGRLKKATQSGKLPSKPVSKPANEPLPISSPLKGLTNMGNTCFFNSTLQCLNSTVPLTQQAHRLQAGPVCAAFNRTIQALMSKGGRDYRPSEIHSEVIRRFRQFKGFGQHDSHELLRCLVDAMATEETKASVRPAVVEGVFGGELLSTVLCENCIREGKGRAISRSTDPIMDISLEMSRKTGKQPTDLTDLMSNYRLDIEVEDFSGTTKRFAGAEPALNQEIGSLASLESCLAAFTRCEPMTDRDNLYDCSRCKVKSRAIRRLLMAKPPEVLVLHLKRFSSSGRHAVKLTSFVSYPHTLDISPYCIQTSETPIPLYRLYAISVHSGGLNGGHYVAYVQQGGEWYYCSDSHVSKVRDTEVLRQQAYVLFYQAQSPINPYSLSQIPPVSLSPEPSEEHIERE
jgi:ubiquitin C-terminal hydrolase